MNATHPRAAANTVVNLNILVEVGATERALNFLGINLANVMGTIFIGSSADIRETLTYSIRRRRVSQYVVNEHDAPLYIDTTLPGSVRPFSCIVHAPRNWDWNN